MRVLLTSWATFTHGEATAGDVLSVRRVAAGLDSAGIAFDTAWSKNFAPGELTLDDAQPADYTHLVFVCGPCHGWQVEELHTKFADLCRIAVGVSVIDPDAPAVTGFHRVIARDGGDRERPDLAAFAPLGDVPVAALIEAPGQGEYGHRRQHDAVHARIVDVLSGRGVAILPTDTRLDTRNPLLPAVPEQMSAVLRRTDVVVTTRLHGLVLALRCGVPVVAVDPVEGGAKVSAQARALGWPALVAASDIADGPGRIEYWLDWCLSDAGRSAARGAAESMTELTDPTTELITELTA